MTLHRRAARRDANESPIVQLFRAAGCTVQPLSAPGCPDLLVGLRGVTFLVEVKDGAQRASQRRLTPAQQDWHRRWRGGPIFVVERLEQVGAVIGMATKGRRESE